jgi:hypothetical protein
MDNNPSIPASETIETGPDKGKTEAELHREVFSSEVSDMGYFLYRCRHHGIATDICCDCAAVLAPDRRFKWVRDSDRKPLCDDCSATYDLL